MKLLYYFSALVAFALFLVCCNKKKDDPNPTPPPVVNPPANSGALSASISGGANVTATNAKAVYTRKIMAADTSYSFYVEGKNTSTNQLINFTIRSSVEHKTNNPYSITLASTSTGYYFENKDLNSEKIWSAPKVDVSAMNKSYGTVQITELSSSNAKGTYSFTAYTLSGGTGIDTTRTITNGTFDAPLTRQGF